MKKLFYILTLAATASLMFSCQKEKPAHEPGPADPAGCYGVYFPSQEASGSHVYNPTQDPVIEIQVSRTNSSGAITVPLTTSFSEDGIFEVEPIVFADGQKETTTKVRFDKAAEGTTYKASLLVEDPQYVSNYNANPIGLDFSIMRVEMKTLKTEDGSATAKVTFTDATFWGEVHDDITIEYYELDNVRYCQTVGGKLLSPADGTEGEGPWGTGRQLSFKWYTKQTVEVNDKEYQWIEVEPCYMGYDSSSGPVYLGDYYWMRSDMGLSNGDYESSYDRYTKGTDGYLPSYYDGQGGFIINAAYWIHGTTSWYGYKDNTPVGIAEGYLRVDYSFKAEADYSSEGVTPIYMEAGVDVSSVKYAVYEGELTATQANNKVEEIIADGKAAVFSDFALDEEEAVKYATLELEPETTGVYTFVAVAYGNEAGKEPVAQTSAYVSFKHIAAGDIEEHAVEVSVFTEDTPARYTNYHAYDSFAYGIAGKDLTDVHVAIFKMDDFLESPDAYFDAVKKDAKGKYAVSEEVLAQVGGEGGYYTVATGMPAKTKMIVIVWATNGDMDAWDYAVYTTDKLPYVWNSLGKGTLTDGFMMGLFSMDDVTVACDVYEEKSTPGLYMVTGFQLELCAAFYEKTVDEIAEYEGQAWWNAELVVDATKPDAVSIPEQDYGIYVNSTYGYIMIDSEPTGTLADGAVTFPAKELYVGLTGPGKWYYGNSNGTFKITFPAAAASAPALTPASEGKNTKTNFVLAREAREWAKPVVVFERDPKPVAVAAEVSYTRKEKSNSSKAIETATRLEVR